MCFSGCLIVLQRRMISQSINFYVLNLRRGWCSALSVVVIVVVVVVIVAVPFDAFFQRNRRWIFS